MTGDIEHSLLNAELLYIISFLGSLLFLFEARKVLPQWYLAIPLNISLFLQTIVYFASYFGIGFIARNFMRIPPAMIIGIPIVLLSASSILVFLSLHKYPASTKSYIVILSIMSIISIVGLLNHQLIGGYYTLMSYYWAFGMPIIGMCFLIKAVTYKNPEKALSPVTTGSTLN